MKQCNHFNWSLIIVKSSHQRCSMKQGVLRNFTKFTGKYLCQNIIVNKVAGLRPATLLKKRLWHRCFPVNFVKFLRTRFLQNTSGRLLLYCSKNNCKQTLYRIYEKHLRKVLWKKAVLKLRQFFQIFLKT